MKIMYFHMLIQFVQFVDLMKQYGITREECDELAVMSHARACKAIDEGKFREQIVPVGDFDTDEHPRSTTLEKLAALAARVEALEEKFNTKEN